MNRFIQIDEEGYFCLQGHRINDAAEGRSLFENLKFDKFHRLTTFTENKRVFVEAFNAPFVVQQISISNNTWSAIIPYGLEKEFKLQSLTLDEWDRFHGQFKDGMHFLFSRKAQAEFFNLLSSFTDNTITFKNQTHTTSSWMKDFKEAESEGFWTNIYLTETPRWDLGSASPLLKSALPQLKLPKSRIAVLGCGNGHDAAFLAQQGHIVTAFDISNEAIQGSKKKYSNVKNLTFHKADVFNLSKEFHSEFDLCLDHTFYCAIAPSKRNSLVKIWRQLLTDQGFLLAIFLISDKPIGPPYGASEWEIKKRLDKGFQSLYWTRAKNSIEKRISKELLVYARKI